MIAQFRFDYVIGLGKEEEEGSGLGLGLALQRRDVYIYYDGIVEWTWFYAAYTVPFSLIHLISGSSSSSGCSDGSEWLLSSLSAAQLHGLCRAVIG